jgi:hypothetical protein
MLSASSLAAFHYVTVVFCTAAACHVVTTGCNVTASSCHVPTAWCHLMIAAWRHLATAGCHVIFTVGHVTPIGCLVTTTVWCMVTVGHVACIDCNVITASRWLVIQFLVAVMPSGTESRVVWQGRGTTAVVVAVGQTAVVAIGLSSPTAGALLSQTFLYNGNTIKLHFGYWTDDRSLRVQCKFRNRVRWFMPSLPFSGTV